MAKLLKFALKLVVVRLMLVVFLLLFISLNHQRLLVLGAMPLSTVFLVILCVMAEFTTHRNVIMMEETVWTLIFNIHHVMFQNLFLLVMDFVMAEPTTLQNVVLMAGTVQRLKVIQIVLFPFHLILVTGIV